MSISSLIISKNKPSKKHRLFSLYVSYLPFRGCLIYTAAVFDTVKPGYKNKPLLLMCLLRKERSLMRVYEGYGTGHPVYTIKGNQVYQGYGIGHPVYTLKNY